jgi:hypothetical protein
MGRIKQQSVISAGEIALRLNSTFDEPVLSGKSASPTPDEVLRVHRMSITGRQGEA